MSKKRNGKESAAAAAQPADNLPDEIEDDSGMMLEKEPLPPEFLAILDGGSFDPEALDALLSQIYLLRSTKETLRDGTIIRVVNLLNRDDVPRELVSALLEVTVMASIMARFRGRAELGVESLIEPVICFVDSELTLGRKADLMLLEKALLAIECMRSEHDLDRGTSVAALLKGGAILLRILKFARGVRGIPLEFKLHVLSTAEVYLEGIGGWSLSDCRNAVLQGAKHAGDKRCESEKAITKFLRPKEKSSAKINRRLDDASIRLETVWQLALNAFEQDLRAIRGN